ncbi:MAG: ATP-binding domain-containing protein [Burkholderiales bacterium]|nr:ATP-binding domain-containing protein [Burkholderiales bacterium]
MPDFSKPGIFAELEAGFAAATPNADWTFDEVIVDEGQDFEPRWVEPLFRLACAGARLWWLEDPMQNLYGRAPVPIPGWTILHADTNYRSPRDILDHLNRLLTLDRPIAAGSALAGSEVEILTYADTAGLVAQTRLALDQAIAVAFRKDMIAVVSFRGREGSALGAFDQLGGHRLRRFTGGYDALGSPVYSEGEVLLDSVYRFKGRSAPCVILTEIDFEALGEIEMRKVFVGATRATMKLFLVMSEGAAGVMLDRFGTR